MIVQLMLYGANENAERILLFNFDIGDENKLDVIEGGRIFMILHVCLHFILNIFIVKCIDKECHI